MSSTKLKYMKQSKWNAWFILSVLWFLIHCAIFAYPSVPIDNFMVNFGAILSLINLVFVIVIGCQPAQDDEPKATTDQQLRESNPKLYYQIFQDGIYFGSQLGHMSVRNDADFDRAIKQMEILQDSCRAHEED